MGTVRVVLLDYLLTGKACSMTFPVTATGLMDSIAFHSIAFRISSSSHFLYSSNHGMSSSKRSLPAGKVQIGRHLLKEILQKQDMWRAVSTML